MKRIETIGPFRFITKGENIKPIIQEMYNENIFFKKIVNNSRLKVDILFDKGFDKLNDELIDGEWGISGYYNTENKKISMRNNIKDIKAGLIHEYVHFIQDMNIRKNFPNLTMNKIAFHNRLYNFVLSILMEADAYTKEYVYEMGIENINNNDMKNLLNNKFEFLLYKYNAWGYAEQYNFIDMKKNIFTKEKFIQIADCILKSLTDDKFGGKIYPQYDLDWNYIFEELRKAYIINKNFDIIQYRLNNQHRHNYQNVTLPDIFVEKFSNDTALIKNFLLNFKGPIYRNEEKRKFISLLKQNCYQ